MPVKTGIQTHLADSGFPRAREWHFGWIWVGASNPGAAPNSE